LGVLQPWWTPAAREIANTWPLDFNHVRAQISENLRAPRASKDTRQVENF